MPTFFHLFLQQFIIHCRELLCNSSRGVNVSCLGTFLSPRPITLAGVLGKPSSRVSEKGWAFAHTTTAHR